MTAINDNFSKQAMSVERFKNKPSPIPFVLEKLIPQNTVGAITATGGVGKSTLAIQLSMQIALSHIFTKPFLGTFEINHANKVLYLSGEDTDIMNWHKIHSNVSHIISESDLDPEIVWNELEQNFLLPDLSGKSTPLTRVDKGQVMTTAMYDRIHGAIERFQPNFIIIDTKSRFSGVGENDNSLVAQEITHLEALVKPSNATLVIVHHTPKGNINIARGASSFQDNLRWVINLSPSKEENDAVLVTNIKQNFGRKVPQFIIKRTSTFWFESFGEVLIEEVPIIEIIVEAMIESGNLERGQEEVVELVQSVNDGYSKRAIRSAIKAGVEDGVIIDTGSKNGRKLKIFIKEKDND